MTHHPNSIVTQKFQHFCLITKLSHVSQFLSSLFAKMMDPPTDTTQKNMVATRVFKPSYIETQIHHHQWQTLHPPPSTKLHLYHHQWQSKNPQPQPQPPPPTAFNTTTTSTKKSEWIKNPNPPTAFNQICLIEEEKKKKKKEEASGLTALQPSSREEKKKRKKKESAKRRNQSEEERKKKRDPNHGKGFGLMSTVKYKLMSTTKGLVWAWIEDPNHELGSESLDQRWTDLG